MEAPVYRFQVGTRVICRTGPDEWSAGEIVRLNYSERGWPAGKTVPYQVALDDGVLIFVPKDSEQLCRKLVPPWWIDSFRKSKSLYAEYNPSAESLAREAAGNDVNAKDLKGNTALMTAVMNTWPNAISTLVRMKADVDIANREKTRPIHIAAAHGKDIIKLLVDAGADLNCQDQDPDFDPEFTSTTFGDRLEHRTPLHYACLEGDAEGAMLLLEAKAKIDIRDAQWKTPLHLAMEAEQSVTIDVLLCFGADINLGNQSSGFENSPLMDAASAGKTELVQKLIAAKADVHKKGKQQMSALHLAARSRRTEVVKVLLDAQADPNQESNVGTALQLARKNGGTDPGLLDAFGCQLDAPAIVSDISSLDAAQRAALFLE